MCRSGGMICADKTDRQVGTLPGKFNVSFYFLKIIIIFENNNNKGVRI
jgi:hypothetical protein